MKRTGLHSLIVFFGYIAALSIIIEALALFGFGFKLDIGAAWLVAALLVLAFTILRRTWLAHRIADEAERRAADNGMAVVGEISDRTGDRDDRNNTSS